MSQGNIYIESTLQPNQIVGVDDDRILVQTEDGIVCLSRYCTHMGADLSLGYMKDGKIRCPWHNLWFDPKTGKQPCRNLENLKFFPLDDNGGQNA